MSNGVEMKLSEMNPEQRREYNRNAKRQQRAKEEAERMRSMVPLARDYMMPESQQKKLTEYSHGLQKTIAADLNLETLPGPDMYIVDAVASVLFGLENSVTQIVNDPVGVIVCGWFPDAAASEAIEHVHRFPKILQSTTFSDLYNKFLHQVARWIKKNEKYSSPEFVRDIKAGIAGTYVLPPLPEPRPEPPKIPEIPAPSFLEVLEQGRIRLLTELQEIRVQNPNVSPEAQRYLDHGPTRR
jgi:hypothetical protein